LNARQFRNGVQGLSWSKLVLIGSDSVLGVGGIAEGSFKNVPSSEHGLAGVKYIKAQDTILIMVITVHTIQMGM
jgi:hypothetical protein